MVDTFDIESLVHVEQIFYDAGFADGHAHGRIHGLIEGRALGREKGFEIWEELGFYEGAARLWGAVLVRQDPNARAAHHATQLLTLLARVPRSNPSPTDDAAPDLSALLRQIRSRYKTLCAVLGVRASLRAVDTDGGVDGDADEGEGGSGGGRRKRSVWRVDGDPQGRETGLNF